VRFVCVCESVCVCASLSAVTHIVVVFQQGLESFLSSVPLQFGDFQGSHILDSFEIINKASQFLV
jgi:hypothetical protein